MLRRGMSKVLICIFVIVCFIGVLAMIIPSTCGCGGAHEAQDLERVRDMGTAMSLYYKKYGAYPALTDMQATPGPADINSVRKSGGQPACLALKLLLAGGFVEDPRLFFSPRSPDPAPATLAAMARTLDPRKDRTWFCTYAYDPGHRPTDGAVPFFGSAGALRRGSSSATAHVLTCECVAKEVDPDADGIYFVRHPVNGKNDPVQDDIYTDDSKTMGWRDSFLQWDVPGNLP